jgi:hypothetical protein
MRTSLACLVVAAFAPVALAQLTVTGQFVGVMTTVGSENVREYRSDLLSDVDLMTSSTQSGYVGNARASSTIAATGITLSTSIQISPGEPPVVLTESRAHASVTFVVAEPIDVIVRFSNTVGLAELPSESLLTTFLRQGEEVIEVPNSFEPLRLAPGTYTLDLTNNLGNQSESQPVLPFVEASRSASASIVVVEPAGCDSPDFNNNGVFPEDADILDFFAVLAGGNCESCNDIDFNNDEVFPDDQDILDFFTVLAGGECA